MLRGLAKHCAVTDLRSSIYLVYKEEFRFDLIKDCEYLHREEKTTAREPFNLTKCSRTVKMEFENARNSSKTQ